jgi:gamma-glutamyltranspeptidase / glutathione hydrolase
MTLTRSRWTLSKSEVTADTGLVVAGKALAAEAGVEMLQQGGNAVDAAVATGWAIGVAEPWMNGIGGTGAMVVHFDGAPVAMEFGARAPLAARPDMYSVDYSRGPAGQFGWPPIQDQENEVGYRSVAVPGLVAGLCRIHQRFGRLPLSVVMEPAIRLADLGYDVDWHSALLIGIHLPHLLRFPDTGSVFLRDGAYPSVPTIPPGRADRIVQKDLADSLRHIARHGVDGYYRGELATAIAESMSANGGLVSLEDLAAYEPRVFEGALHGSYRDVDVFGLPGATGGPMLLEILNILEGHDIRGLGPDSVPTLHFLAEACRRAYEDHFQFGICRSDPKRDPTRRNRSRPDSDRPLAIRGRDAAPHH